MPRISEREIAELTQEEEDILAQLEEDEDDAEMIERSPSVRARMQAEVAPASPSNRALGKFKLR